MKRTYLFRRKHWKVHKNVTRINKNGEEITKNMSYRLHFIDNGKFMVSSLSNLVNNISEGIHKIKCKYRHDDKNVKLAELNINIGTVFFFFFFFFNSKI